MADTAAAPGAAELSRLLLALTQPSALVELTAVGACVALAWVIVRLVRGAEPPPSGSVWFGRRIVDGVAFPVVALLLALLAKWLLRDMVSPAVFRLVVPILLSLAVIRLTVRVLRAALPHVRAVRIVERTVSWLAWIAVVLWVTGVLPLVLAELDAMAWTIGGTTISVRNLIEGVISAVAVVVLALWASAAIERKLLAGATGNLSVRKIAANALRALLLLVGLLMALSAAGVDLTALGVLGGAIGVGIGFGLQKLAANYVSGFVLLAEDSVRIGDIVHVDGFEGRITDISTRYTRIRAPNGRESIVPNEMMMTSRIENLTLADSHVLLRTTVQVAYGSDVGRLLPELAAVVAAVPRVLAEPAPAVLLTAFAADGLELTVGFWIADPDHGQANVRSEVNLALLAALAERGVEIPFPQRVLHHAAGPAAQGPGQGPGLAKP